MTVKARHRIKARTLALVALVSLLFGSAMAIAVTPAQAAPAPMTIEQAQHVAAPPASIVVNRKVLYPYGCQTAYPGWFCLYGDLAFGHINTSYPASINRNECNSYQGHGEIPPTGPPYYLPGLPATWTYAVVNTSVVSWRVFRTRTCGGSSLTVNGHTSLALGSGWAAVVDFAFMRTSTVSWP